MNLVSHLLFSP